MVENKDVPKLKYFLVNFEWFSSVRVFWAILGFFWCKSHRVMPGINDGYCSCFDGTVFRV